ncbi:MAG: OmpA family protein [Bacteroidia bacterium]
MNRLIPFLFCLLFVSVLGAQTMPPAYMNAVNKANKAYRQKNYKLSTQSFSVAFKANHGKARDEDRIAAALAWAGASEPDSAFYYLHFLVNQREFSRYEELIKEPELEVLHSDKRWKPMLEQIKRNADAKEARLNRPLMKKLDSILYKDQHRRLMMDSMEKRFGSDSKEMKTLREEISQDDSENLGAVKAILDREGWLGEDAVGRDGNLCLFLVIQHAGQRTQEKYLPVMREAVNNGKARASDLALLEDRVALKQGRKQIYGSQIIRDEKTGKNKVAPLIDSIHVNKRRAEVGLGPLEDYAALFDIQLRPLVKVKPRHPFAGRNNDIERAIDLKDSIERDLTVCIGFGKKMEFDNGKSRFSENNSAWYRIKIHKDTTLTFDMVHDGEDADLDFALFHCEGKDCMQDISSGKLKPCRVSNGGFGTLELPIGLSLFARNTNDGSPYQAGLKVKEGDVVYLLINSDFPTLSHPPLNARGLMMPITIYFNGLAPESVKRYAKLRLPQKPVVINNINFETGKAILKRSSWTALDSLAEQVKKSKYMRIEIRGHTDNVGEEEANQKLSEDRAKAVVDYLISKEIDKSRLTFIGFGSAKPLEPNDTEEGKRKNRRVEFRILSK